MLAIDLKPFSVLSGKYLFWFVPAEEGGFTVTCQNVPGVNAQGDSFEDALQNASSMAKFVEACQADMQKEASTRRPRRSPRE